MDVGNIERKGKYREKCSRQNLSKHGNASQRPTDFAKNACFVRDKEGCKAWKHKAGKTANDIEEVKNAAFFSSSSETS